MSNGEPCYWDTILFVLYSFILRNYKQNKRKTQYTMNNNQGVFETLFHLNNNLNVPLFWNTCY